MISVAIRSGEMPHLRCFLQMQPCSYLKFWLSSRMLRETYMIIYYNLTIIHWSGVCIMQLESVTKIIHGTLKCTHEINNKANNKAKNVINN